MRHADIAVNAFVLEDNRMKFKDRKVIDTPLLLETYGHHYE